MKQQIPVSKLAHDQHQVQIIPLGDEMPYDFKKPHRHEYFEFFVFFNGGGVHYIDFVEYPILDYSVHIVFPSQIHLLKRTGARGLIIICRKEFMSVLGKVFYAQLYQNNFSSPCIVFSKDNFPEIKQTVTKLQEELESGRTLSAELINSYMSIFLAGCIRQFNQSSDPLPTPTYSIRELEVYKRFSNLLDEHFFERQNVSFYADLMNITPKVLNSCIGKVTGKTCMDMIQERTLTEAKRLLLYTDESSKEIAYNLNFKDNSYFTRFFLKLEGQTPKEFKAFWEEKYHS